MPLVGAILVALLIWFVLFPVEFFAVVVVVFTLGWPFMLAAVCVFIFWAAFS